jgi:hypothetical protein
MSCPRQLAELLPNGQVLAVCGVAAETYNPATGTWTDDGGATPPAARNYSTALLSTGKVLVSGGENGSYPAKETLTGARSTTSPGMAQSASGN